MIKLNKILDTDYYKTLGVIKKLNKEVDNLLNYKYVSVFENKKTFNNSKNFNKQRNFNNKNYANFKNK